VVVLAPVAALIILAAWLSSPGAAARTTPST
jgi:hypothetical protein